MYIYLFNRKESFMIAKAAIIRIGNYGSFAFTTVFLSFIGFSTFAGTGGEMNARTVFTTLGIFTYIRLYFILFLIICLFLLSEASVAIKRIEVCMNIVGGLSLKHVILETTAVTGTCKTS